MNRHIVNHKFFLISVAFLAVALLLRAYFIDESKNEAQFAATVTKNIHSRLDVIHEDLQKVASHLQQVEEYSFSQLNLETEYPYYIFHNGSLIYWSDFRFVPDYNSLAGNYDDQLVSLKNGQYISHRLSLQKDQTIFELFSLLPVINQSKIDNNYIESGFNTEIFSNTSLSIKTFTSPGDASIYTSDGKYLFSIDFLRGFQFSSLLHKALVFGLILVSIGFLLIYIGDRVHHLVRKGYTLQGLLFLTLSLLTIRGLMLYFDFPFAMTEFDLFNSRFFASSIFNPSLGDLLLNNLVLFVIVYFVAKNSERFPYKAVFRSLNEISRFFVAILLAVVGYTALYYEFFIIRTLYYHSQWSLDITSSISFSYFKSISFFIFFINAILYFIIAHGIFKLLINITRKKEPLLIAAFCIGTLIFVTVGHLAEFHFGVVAIVHFLYFLFLYIFKLPSSLRSLSYNTFLYFFISSLASAAVGAFAVYTFEQMKTVNSKNQFANQLLIDNDIRGEYLLADASQKIRQDLFIQNRLYSPFYSKDIIEQKVRRVYLNNYLDRYDIQVHMFNAQGRPYQNYQIPGLSVFVDAFVHPQFETDYEGIYFINEASLSALKRYLVFIDMRRYGSVVGYLILDLRLKRIIPNTVYPELIVDKRFMYPNTEASYSYGIYQDGELINSAGVFNYQKELRQEVLADEMLFEKGLVQNDFHHLGMRGLEGKVIIISSELYSFRNILANFSFLFLILVFCVSFLILFVTFYRGQGRLHLNFASKIQLYLNLAFFLPLLIVSVSTISLISSSYRKDIIDSYNQKAESISTNIGNLLDSYALNQVGREKLSNELSQIARFSESDINLFSTTGRLISTSQPTIYENDLLSEYINPRALAIIKEQNNSKVILEEKVGSLFYKSAYVGVKSFETGELMGIISIPFFESQYELEEEIIDILTNIMNVFTFIFIIILIVSYFASKALTHPLKYITQKIKKTSLAAYNEPLVWKSNDEIGLLVGEYNRMLENLEQSKLALSKTEKESAWREMAKQVAHEIKNPLTPMKLTLQHLQRLLNEDKATHRETLDRSFNTLLEQIETLSDIATSFSSFAKMPVPKQEPFELISVLKGTVNLFQNEEKAVVHFDFPHRIVNVEGDQQLMGRIFSNLIINGIQSVPSKRAAKINISLQFPDPGQVRILISDNGEGIDPSIRDKIFVPNFSTKYAGSGIGLAIAKRGIEHAGGSIRFESTTDEGTTFIIDLPIMH